MASTAHAVTAKEYRLKKKKKNCTCSFLSLFIYSHPDVSCLCTRNSAAHDISVQLDVTQSDVHVARYTEETTGKQVTFREPVSNSEVDDPESEGKQNEREPSANWSSGSPYNTAIEDSGSLYSPYLPAVLEEPSSSFSEGCSYSYFAFSSTVLSEHCCLLFKTD